MALPLASLTRGNLDFDKRICLAERGKHSMVNIEGSFSERASQVHSADTRFDIR